MSAQPARDAGQLQKNKIRRHSVNDSIVPRHFLQTAQRNGVPERVVEEICADLLERADTAIAQTLAALPKDFPSALAESITGGLRARLQLIERAAP